MKTNEDMKTVSKKSMDNLKRTQGEKMEFRKESKNARIFKKIGEEEYLKKNGCITRLIVWEADCIVCGDMFTVKTPVKYENNAVFGIINCQKHRLTKEELKKIFSSNAKERASVKRL